MCGFAGVIAWDERYRVSRETLGRMSAAIAHRGPDGEGYYLEGDATQDRPQVALAFRRLAILDPDPRSNQPFTDGRHWLVFNGEIYNFRELREELKKLDPSYAWRTTGDTEVLLRSYAAWGEKCVEHLNGMFAFAIWDAAKQTLLLARDRMGQKPLYYAFAPGGVIAIASELLALRALTWIDTTVYMLNLHIYLRFGYSEAMSTMFTGISQLPPGATLRCNARTLDGPTAYFKPNAIQPNHPPATAETTRSFVTQAVRRQLVSDVPLGCFLSGGIDSSIIAASMKASAAEVLTFSIGFDDPQYDETQYAEAVAKHLGTKHHRFVVRPDAASDLPKLAAVFGDPFADSSALPTHYLSRETRQHVKVALSGDGGDELFGGYQRYRAMRLGAIIARIPRPLLGFLAGPVTGQLPSAHPKSVASRMRRFLSTINKSAAARYASYIQLFDDPTITALLGRGMDGFIESGFEVFRETRADDVVTALAFDRITYLPGDLLTKVDRASMLHALEVRSPFMDHELVQFAASLTTDQLLRGGPKRMLREAFAADLPDFVFKRRKMGFAVPIGDWFRGELRPMLRDHLFATDSFARQHFDMATVERLVLEHEQSRVDHSQRLYALLMLELWHRLQKPGG